MAVTQSWKPLHINDNNNNINLSVVPKMLGRGLLNKKMNKEKISGYNIQSWLMFKYKTLARKMIYTNIKGAHKLMEKLMNNNANYIYCTMNL